MKLRDVVNTAALKYESASAAVDFYDESQVEDLHELDEIKKYAATKNVHLYVTKRQAMVKDEDTSKPVILIYPTPVKKILMKVKK